MVTCELGFQPLFYCTVHFVEGGMVLEGLWTIWSNSIFFFQFFMVIISGGVGRFAPIVMVVKRRDATGAWYWKGLNKNRCV
jgi:hypothetical protein